MQPKQNVIERTTTTIVARGSHSDFSLGASDANDTDVSSPTSIFDEVGVAQGWETRVGKHEIIPVPLSTKSVALRF
jgi:hypothetical protein